MKRAEAKEDNMQVERDQPQLFTEVLAENLQQKDPTMNFMDRSKKEVLANLYNAKLITSLTKKLNMVSLIKHNSNIIHMCCSSFL
jgi:hypothetical protein